VSVEPGDTVCAHLSSHNRDEARYESPDAFRITRERLPRGVFGYGAHACLGMHLARAEMRTALQLALMRLPNLRIDPDSPPPVIRGDIGFASPASLHVLFDPAGRR
jgi:cytochrome P450